LKFSQTRNSASSSIKKTHYFTMATFLSSLLSELVVQHSSDVIVIECDRAAMPAPSLRKRTRRPSSTRTSSYARSVSSSAINIARSPSLDDINKQTTKLAVIYDNSEIIVLLSPPPSPTNKMGGTTESRQISPCSVQLLVCQEHALIRSGLLNN
jgi:hypothetical protein